MDRDAIAWSLFRAVFHPWMRSRIRLHLTGVAHVPTDRPVLLVANHESYWDGFLLERVAAAVRPGGRYRAVMLARELERHGWLRYLGALGVEPGSLSSGRAFLRRLAALPDDTVLAWFPQGRIAPTSARPLGFASGVRHALRALAPVTVVPVGLRILPGRTPRSEAYVSLARPIQVTSSRAGDADPVPGIEDAVAFQLDAIEAFLARHQEGAPEAWPPASARLRRGAHAPWRLDAHPLSLN